MKRLFCLLFCLCLLGCGRSADVSEEPDANPPQELYEESQ
jgi:hypothetical protein